VAHDPFPDGFEPPGYGRYTQDLARQELERFFFLDDVDRQLIAKRRGDHTRLGFALQLATVRYLGTFMADPLDVPTTALDYLAEQLAIDDAYCVKAYLERRQTRFEHQWEIAQEYGWREFAEAEGDLARWIDDRAWLTGDGPRMLFDAAVVWLGERQVLLPAASTIARLVGRVGEEATQRFWHALATVPTPAQAGQLEALLDVAPGSRLSDLDRLRQGPNMASGRSMSTDLKVAAVVLGATALVVATGGAALAALPVTGATLGIGSLEVGFTAATLAEASTYLSVASTLATAGTAGIDCSRKRDMNCVADVAEAISGGVSTGLSGVAGLEHPLMGFLANAMGLGFDLLSFGNFDKSSGHQRQPKPVGALGGAC
jgi:hypothetical protein